MSTPFDVSRIVARKSALALRRVGTLLGVLAALLAVSATPVRAQTTVHVDAVFIDGDEICTLMTNHTTAPVTVSMATYNILFPTRLPYPTQEDMEKQVFHAGNTVTIPALSSVIACVSIPDGVEPICLFQFDIFTGPIIPVFKGSDHYAGRLLMGWIYYSPRCEEVGIEGCTPGYWKNHEDSWAATGYSPAQTLESVFDVPDTYGLDNVQLMAALSLKGGPSVADKAAQLCHHAVAAVLNAAHSDVEYPMTIGQIIQNVNATLASGDGDAMLQLKDLLDAYNNGGCTLN